MSKVSFEKTVVPTPVEGVTIETTTTACPPKPEDTRDHAADTEQPAAPIPAAAALAPRSESPHAIFDDSAIGFEDIILPKLNIVQKVGDLSNVFQQGEIVLDQTHVIYSPAKPVLPGQIAPAAPAPLNIVVIGFKRTSYVEKVEGGGLGMHCRTTDEVVRAGGTLDYKEWAHSVKSNKENPAIKVLRKFDNMTTVMVLVEKPATFVDNNASVFPYEVAGKFYVLAFQTMKASAYNAGAKTLFTWKKTKSFGNPKISYSDSFFTQATELKKFPTGTFAWVPDIRAAAPTDSETLRLVNSIKGV